MAVVQISRIQHRRGQKNTGSGLPQLASGEIGWAIDTRELYIGNGSVSEGAPAVGNTKILTEYDNILDFASIYFYKANDGFIQTGDSTASPVSRSLQSRLDDFVSVRSFGAVGDGVTDDTQALQRAIDQLYINPATKTTPGGRFKLRVEPGTYRITETLYIPPYCSLIGSGSNKTVIEYSGEDEVFRTVNGLSQPGEPGLDSETDVDNQARHIVIEGLSLHSSQSVKFLVLQDCRNSVFRDVSIQGNWEIIVGEDLGSIGIELKSLSTIVSSDNNVFENCFVNQVSYCVQSNRDVKYNIFENCVFQSSYKGFSFGENMSQPGSPGQQTGPLRNEITRSVFKNISRQCILIERGVFNISDSNSFVEVGNDQGSELEAVSEVIKFAEKTNRSLNDYFSRTESLISGSGTSDVPYIPEISGATFYSLNNEQTLEFNESSRFRLPGVYNQSYEVDYTLVSPSYFRSGKLFVMVDGYNNFIEIDDEFNHIGESAYLCDIRFNGLLKNLSGNGSLDTIEIKIQSTVPDTESRTFSFTVNSKNTETT